jgi:pimeloyl-ACP methyl ester carboxylesterase
MHTRYIDRSRAPLLTFRETAKPSYARRRVADERRRDSNVKTRDVAARGARIRFAEAGAGRPLILLHDYLSSRIAWDAVLPRLASRFRLIAPDLPGFGESEKPPHGRYAYGFDSFAESIVDLIAAIGASRVSLCGHGLGGAVAVALAATHPHVVDRLVLVNPLVYPARVDLLARVASVPFVGAFAFKQLYSRTLFRRYVGHRAYGPRARDRSEKIDELFDLFNTPSGREAGHATLVAMLDTRSLSASLSRVHAPTLVAWGRDDERALVDEGRRLSREIRGARFEAIEGGRSPHEQAPDAFVDGVVRFLSETRGV